MKAEPASASYTKLKAIINRFFNNSFSELVREAEKEFQKPVINWLKDVHKVLLNKKSGESNPYKASIDVLDEKLSSLESVIKSVESHSRFNTATDLLLQKLEDVPVEVIENQAEDRFKCLPNDSFVTGMKKSVKRRFRNLTSSVGNRKWNQKINLRDLLAEELFLEPDWMETWIAESFKDTTEIIGLFLAKETAGDTDEVDSEGKESFEIEIVNKFEKHLEQAIMRVESEEILSNEELESQLLKIKDRITERSVRAGTIEGSKPKLKYEAVKRKIDNHEKRFFELEVSWIHFLNSQAADLRIQTEIAGYGYKVSEVQKKILDESHCYFRDFGYVPMENGVSSSREIADALVKHKSGKLSNKLIESIRQKVDLEIKEAILAPMRDLNLQQEMMDRIRSHISDLQLELSRFSESIQLAEEREIVMPKPLVKYDKLQWRSLASRFLQEKALREMAPEQMLLVEFINEMADEVKTQEYLKEHYFTRLSNVAEGNLSIAIIFWLQSIGDFDQNTFYMQPLEVADVDKLEVPSRSVLFTLAAFVIHDKLTTEEMALALHKKVPECSLMLARLKSKGIIIKTENGYLMNHLVYRQVIRLLKRRNIIH